MTADADAGAAMDAGVGVAMGAAAEEGGPVAIEELHVVPAYRSVCIDALGDLRLRP